MAARFVDAMEDEAGLFVLIRGDSSQVWRKAMSKLEICSL